MTELDKIDPPDLHKLSRDVHTLKGNLAVNTAITQALADKLDAMEQARAEDKATRDANRADIAELLDIFRASKGGVKVLGWVGQFVRWGAPIVAAVIGLWYAMKNGGHQ